MPAKFSFSTALPLALLSSALFISGCGTGGTVVTSSTVPQLSLSASAKAFTAPVGTSAATQSVTLTNSGSATVVFSSAPALGGANPTAFSLVSTCGSSIAVGASCALTIGFTPSAAQTYTATISMADNDASSPQAITLTGTGTSSPTATATLSATSLTFTATSGTTSAAQSVTLSNTGTGALGITSLTLGGANATSFATTNTCGSSLAAGSSCAISVTFSPAAAATYAATLTLVVTNAPAASLTQTITLTGTGSASSGTPNASLTSSAVTFSATPQGTTAAAQTVTLANSGTAALAIGSIVLSGPNAANFSQTNTCGTSVGSGSACVFTISFTPPGTGTYTALITITDNAGNSPQSITLTGTGSAPAPVVTLSATSLTFAATTVNTSATPQSVTITNSGSATLTGLALTIGGANASAFTNNSTCGSTLAIGASCTATINFSPNTLGANSATLSIADNATGAPQTVTLSGTGQAAPAPVVTLSGTTMAFPTTLPATTSAALNVVLTNTGNATLNIASITLSGSGAADFTMSTTCGTTLAATATCTVSATFTPAAATSYSATITITDNNNNVANSTQTIALTGTGGTSTTYHTLYVFPESDNSATPLYALINGANSTIDMTMYALQDLTFTTDLINACKRGVVVRVILDQNNEKSNDTPDFNLLNAQAGCTAVWANKAFQVTHEKSFIIDSKTVSIMSLNLQAQYYSTTRDYAIVENDANDIAAIQATFNMDFAAGTTAAGVVGTSDYSYQPPAGTDLVWSPTTATANMLAIINNATKTLYIENEEFSASNIVSAVAAAAQRGVAVIFVGESSSYLTNYATIKAAGAKVFYYTSSTGFYVHGKTVVADLGLGTEAVYMGSINYSTASLTQNRELGIYVTGNPAVSNPIAATIAATIVSDESQPGVYEVLGRARFNIASNTSAETTHSVSPPKSPRRRRASPTCRAVSRCTYKGLPARFAGHMTRDAKSARRKSFSFSGAPNKLSELIEKSFTLPRHRAPCEARARLRKWFRTAGTSRQQGRLSWCSLQSAERPLQQAATTQTPPVSR